MNKEEIYDELINPLMAQIIAIANEHGIAFVANFAIPTPEDDNLYCSTHVADENDTYPKLILDMVTTLHRNQSRGPTLHLETINKDGKKTLIAIVP